MPQTKDKDGQIDGVKQRTKNMKFDTKKVAVS